MSTAVDIRTPLADQTDNSRAPTRRALSADARLLHASRVAPRLDGDNAIRAIMNKAKHARLNAAGGWGDHSPMDGIAPAFEAILKNAGRFHAATRYSETHGQAGLREVIAGKLDPEVFGRRGLTPDQVIIASGGSTQLGFQSLLLFGSPVALPDPVYANYLDQAELAGLQVVRFPIVGSDGDFLPRSDPDRVLRDFSRICRDRRPGSVVITSPDNPTGFIWPDDVLDRLIGIADRHDVAVLLDRAYGPFWFKERPDHLSWSPATHPNLITLESFSKSFSLLGLRVGYALAPSAIITRLQALSQRLTLCPSTLEQEALTAFLTDTSGDAMAAYLEEVRRGYCNAYTTARSTVTTACPGVRILEADGGFYLTLRVSSEDEDEARFCDALFDSQGLLVVPGGAFGNTTKGWVRTAFAPHVRDLERLSRVYQVLGDYLNEWWR